MPKMVQNLGCSKCAICDSEQFLADMSKLQELDRLKATNNRTYSYQDNHYFLTQGNGPWGPRSWTYDKIGNRLTEARGATTDSYSYVAGAGAGHTPILSQIQLGAGGARTYQFGPAGHLEQTATGADATLFRNDAASRLSAIERPATQAGVAFRYGLG